MMRSLIVFCALVMSIAVAYGLTELAYQEVPPERMVSTAIEVLRSNGYEDGVGVAGVVTPSGIIEPFCAGVVNDPEPVSIQFCPGIGAFAEWDCSKTDREGCEKDLDDACQANGHGGVQNEKVTITEGADGEWVTCQGPCQQNGAIAFRTCEKKAEPGEPVAWHVVDSTGLTVYR